MHSALYNYTVFYLPEGYESFDDTRLQFICQAENKKHAIEQFTNAEPKAIVQYIEKGIRYA